MLLGGALSSGDQGVKNLFHRALDDVLPGELLGERLGAPSDPLLKFGIVMQALRGPADGLWVLWGNQQDVFSFDQLGQ